jgi:3-oxoacyl-[acyl-carrier protein] reductase
MDVVITGGSRGIGAAAVRQFRAQADRVWFLYEKNHEAAQRLAAETGATPFCADVANEAAVNAAFAQIPNVDVLINNAGIAHYGLITDITPDVWDRLFAVNVKGIYHTVRAAMPHFLRNQAGVILNTSSMWGLVGASCETTYASTKGAVIALTKSLAKELAPSGVRCNCIAPGVIRTEMLSPFSEAELDVLAEETPLGRLGTPEEIAQAMVYLASPAATFITGQVLNLSGGFVIN